jgi:hypothetical protein
MVLKQLVPQVLIKKCFKFQGYGHIASDCLDHKIVVVIEEEITNKDDLPNESDQEDEVVYTNQGGLLIIQQSLNVVHEDWICCSML